MALQSLLQRLRPLKDYVNDKRLLTPGIVDGLFWIFFPIRPRKLARSLGVEFPLCLVPFYQFAREHPHIEEIIRSQRRQKPHYVFSVPSIPLPSDLEGTDKEGVPESFEEDDFVRSNAIHRNQVVEEFARRQIRTRKLVSRLGSTMGFHGSHLPNFFSIFRRGLDTRFVRKGEGLFGDGIYLSCTPEVALNYVGWGNTWHHSALGSRIGCLSVCQVFIPIFTLNAATKSSHIHHQVTDPLFSLIFFWISLHRCIARCTKVVDHPDVLYGKKPAHQEKLPEEYLLVSNNDHVRVWFSSTFLLLSLLVLVVVRAQPKGRANLTDRHETKGALPVCLRRAGEPLSLRAETPHRGPPWPRDRPRPLVRRGRQHALAGEAHCKAHRHVKKQ